MNTFDEISRERINVFLSENTGNTLAKKDAIIQASSNLYHIIAISMKQTSERYRVAHLSELYLCEVTLFRNSEYRFYR